MGQKRIAGALRQPLLCQCVDAYHKGPSIVYAIISRRRGDSALSRAKCNSRELSSYCHARAWADLVLLSNGRKARFPIITRLRDFYSWSWYGSHMSLFWSMVKFSTALIFWGHVGWGSQVSGSALRNKCCLAGWAWVRVRCIPGLLVVEPVVIGGLAPAISRQLRWSPLTIMIKCRVYSHLFNKRGGWNKRVEVAKAAKSLNVQVGINVEGGIFWRKLIHKSNKRGV